MTYTLLLSPGIFKDGNAILKKPWHVTNLDVVNSNAPVQTDPGVKPRKKFVDTQFTDAKNKVLGSTYAAGWRRGVPGHKNQ